MLDENYLACTVETLTDGFKTPLLETSNPMLLRKARADLTVLAFSCPKAIIIDLSSSEGISDML